MAGAAHCRFHLCLRLRGGVLQVAFKSVVAGHAVDLRVLALCMEVLDLAVAAVAAVNFHGLLGSRFLGFGLLRFPLLCLCISSGTVNTDKNSQHHGTDNEKYSSPPHIPSSFAMNVFRNPYHRISRQIRHAPPPAERFPCSSPQFYSLSLVNVKLNPVNF